MKRSLISLLSILPLSFAACGGSGTSTGGGSAGDCTPTGGTNKAQYVANMVSVPTMQSDFAIDLDGDRKPDNNLGLIIMTLNSENLMVQQGVTDAVTMGQLVILASETSTDATYQSDSCASVQIVEGKSTTSPDFSGTGSFTVATTDDKGNAIQPGSFDGAIKAGKFASASPVTTKAPVTMSLSLPLVAGAPALDLTVNAAQVEFTRNAAGTVSGGEIHGVIKNSDVQSKLIPGVATILTTKISGTPDSTTMQISSIFDTGGTPDTTGKCMGTCYSSDTMMCAKKGDGKIDTCEVATSSLVQQLLSPDVQMYASDGVTYKPTPNGKPDSLSLGLGFSLVGAKF